MADVEISQTVLGVVTQDQADVDASQVVLGVVTEGGNIDASQVVMGVVLRNFTAGSQANCRMFTAV